MIHRRCRLILLLLALASLCGPARAAPVTIDPHAGRIDLSERMAVLRDPQRRLAQAEVLAMQDAFTPATRRDLVTSFNPGIFWLRITLEQTGDWPLTRWLAVGTAKTQQVTLFLRQEGEWRALHAGRTVARRDQPLVALEPVFPIELMPGAPRELLLRVDSRGATDMATTLWEPQAYQHAAGKQQMQLAAILAGLLVSGMLALLVFAVLREHQYLWLGLLLSAIAGLEATRTNFLGTYLWPAALAQPAQVLTLFAVIAVFSLSKVVAHALEPARWLPGADRLLLALRWIAVAAALLSLASYGHGVRILSIAAAVQNIATLALCALAWARGQTAGRFFLLAFSLALLTETARQFANLGLLPWIAAMEFSTFLFLLASPLILFGLVEQTRQLSLRLQVAEQLQQAKSAFLARVSHELRAPLATLLGFNRMLARRSEKLSLAEGTAEIEKCAQRLLRFIDELLDEARTAAGKLTLAPAALPLASWLDEIAHSARIVVEANGNQLLCDFTGDLGKTLHADGERLRQVLDNLLANANRHTRHGTIRFACRAARTGAEVALDFAVADDGEGIAPQRLDAIFEPFERGTAEGDGTGLGLPICRELVRQMGGEITVHSVPGQGSRFAFALRFPVVATGDAADAALSPKVGAGGTAIAAAQWQALARLADEGDVSGIEDWIAACRAACPDDADTLGWIADALRRLDLPLLARCASTAADRQLKS